MGRIAKAILIGVIGIVLTVLTLGLYAYIREKRS